MANKKKLLTFGLGGFAGLLVLILLLHQVDAALNPALKVLLNQEFVVSEEEKLFYESFIAQNYCNRTDLNKKQIQEVLTALEEAAPFTSLHLDDFEKRLSCFGKLFSANNSGLFEDLTADFKRNQPATEAVIRKVLSLGLKMTKNPTSIDYLQGTMLIQYALIEAEKVKARNRNYRVPYKSELGDFIQTSLKSRLETIRDQELLIVAKTYLPQISNANLDASFLSRLISSFFLQKNRTLNKVYARWNQAIAWTEACQPLFQCEPLAESRMRFYDYLLNAPGNSFAVIMTPNIQFMGKKLSERLTLIEQVFSRLK